MPSKLIKLAGSRYAVPMKNAHGDIPEPYSDVRIAVWGARLGGWVFTGWYEIYSLDPLWKKRLDLSFPGIEWDWDRAVLIRPSVQGRNHRFMVPGSFRDYPDFFAIYLCPGPNSGRSAFRAFGPESKKIFGTQDCALSRAKDLYHEAYQAIQRYLIKHRKGRVVVD